MPPDPSQLINNPRPASSLGTAADINGDIDEVALEPRILRFLRRYVWLALILSFVGLCAGAFSVVLSQPLYSARLLLEIRGINDAWLQNSFEGATSFAGDTIDIQTQLTLLRSGPFLQRVNTRLQAETVPPPPIRQDLFSRLRRRIFPEAVDPMRILADGLETAVSSFQARPINQTRLIELTCNSTSPQIAAQFINAIASEFMAEALVSRSQTSQKTSEWLATQIEETKLRLQEAEKREEDFLQRAGNMFAGHDNATLDDTKLRQLQGELSAMQTARLSKQAKYEMVLKSPHELIAEVLQDPELLNMQAQLRDLERERAALLITLEARHPKVLRLDAQKATIQANLDAKVTSSLARLKSEYEAAARQEELLAIAYNAQLHKVGEVAGKSTENNSLKREVETLRQMYQSLIVQANQAGVTTSVPVNPIRLVEPAAPPPLPYSPKPVVNLGFGFVLGIFLTAVIAFTREKLDRRIHHPKSIGRWLNVPELGVIPSVEMLVAARPAISSLRRLLPNNKATRDPKLTTLVPQAWVSDQAAQMADSFRGIVASLAQRAKLTSSAQILVVTSANAGEGKTTVAAILGIALAEAGRKTLVIDGDFRQPQLHNVFGQRNEWTTLVDLLKEGDNAPLPPMRDFVQFTEVANLSILPNKATNADIAQRLYSPRFRDLMQRVRSEFEVVIVDTAPWLGGADTRMMAPMADGIILVIRAGSTDREEVLETCRCIQADGHLLLGTVLNDWRAEKRSTRYSYGYQMQK